MEDDYVKILLVDGHKNEASKIKACLTQDADKVFQVLHCNAHSDAALILEGDAFETDVIILDLFLMDEVNPQEIYRSISQVAEDIPIIVMTGKDAHSLAREVTACGASDIVIRERFESAPQRLLGAIEFSMIRNRLVQGIKEKCTSKLLNISAFCTG
jgi:DNA-binding NarL/FixJ family response regulator